MSGGTDRTRRGGPDAEVDERDRCVHPGQGARDGSAAVGGEPEEPRARDRRRGSDRAANGLSDSETILLVVIFVLIASATIGGAVLVYLVGGQRAKTMLDGWKVWLGHNNAAVMAVLLLVIGVVLAGKGLDVFD